MADNSFNVEFRESFYSEVRAAEILNELLKLEFKQQRTIVFGRTYTPKRKSISYADDGITYTFAGVTTFPDPWTPLMLELKSDVEAFTGHSYNYALLNLYPDGKSGIGMHKDNEASVDPDSGVPCLSFGATRIVNFYRHGCPPVSLNSSHGSLYVMLPPTNECYTHGIRPQPDVTEPRISITFRQIVMERPAKRRCIDLNPAPEMPDDSPKSPDLLQTALDSCGILLESCCVTAQPDEVVESSPIPSTATAVSDDVNYAPAQSGEDVCGIRDVFASYPASDTDLTNNDWLTMHYQKLDPPSNVIRRWSLEWCTFVTVHSDFKGLRVHIRQFTENGLLDYLPTKNGIIMNAGTWSSFRDQISNFNVCYNTASFIANNQLAVFSANSHCVLHQIFKNDQHFTMKPTFLSLSRDQLVKLQDVLHEINHCVRETLLCHTLPIVLMRKNCDKTVHCSAEQAKLNLMNCVKNEIVTVLSTLYECDGCIVEHPSQKRHDCLNVPNHQKYLVVRDKIYSNLNVFRIVQELCQEYCVCEYSDIFFKDFKFSTYKCVENMLYDADYDF